jgi:hypothetical protein
MSVLAIHLDSKPVTIGSTTNENIVDAATNAQKKLFQVGKYWYTNIKIMVNIV